MSQIGEQVVRIRTRFKDSINEWSFSGAKNTPILSQLLFRLRQTFPDRTFQLTFVDDEGDVCRVSSEQELADALRCCSKCDRAGAAMTLSLTEIPEPDADNECEYVILDLPLDLKESSTPKTKGSGVTNAVEVPPVQSLCPSSTAPSLEKPQVYRNAQTQTTNTSICDQNSAQTTSESSNVDSDDELDSPLGDGLAEEPRLYEAGKHAQNSSFGCLEKMPATESKRCMKLDEELTDSLVDVTALGLMPGQDIVLSCMQPDLAMPMQGVIVQAIGNILTIKLTCHNKSFEGKNFVTKQGDKMKTLQSLQGRKNENAVPKMWKELIRQLRDMWQEFKDSMTAKGERPCVVRSLSKTAKPNVIDPISTAHDVQLAQLVEMGYTDTTTLTRLLAQSRGDVNQVVAWLLAKESKKMT